MFSLLTFDGFEVDKLFAPFGMAMHRGALDRLDPVAVPSEFRYQPGQCTRLGDVAALDPDVGLVCGEGSSQKNSVAPLGVQPFRNLLGT